RPRTRAPRLWSQLGFEPLQTMAGRLRRPGSHFFGPRLRRRAEKVTGPGHGPGGATCQAPRASPSMPLGAPPGRPVGTSRFAVGATGRSARLGDRPEADAAILHRVHFERELVVWLGADSVRQRDL